MRSRTDKPSAYVTVRVWFKTEGDKEVSAESKPIPRSKGRQMRREFDEVGYRAELCDAPTPKAKKKGDHQIELLPEKYLVPPDIWRKIHGD